MLAGQRMAHVFHVIITKTLDQTVETGLLKKLDKPAQFIILKWTNKIT